VHFTHRTAPRALVTLAGACLAALVLTLVLSRPQAHAQRPPAPPAPDIVRTPSPYATRVSSRRVDTVVIHYSSGINVDPGHWDDPALVRRIFARYHVSAHYLIDRGGTVYQLVPEHDVAWHAGGSIMPAPDNRHNVNAFSIGIELVATANSGYTEAQYGVLHALLAGIRARHPITHIVGHDEISGQRAVQLGLRRDLKVDPGAHLDWSRVRP
jgi:N-acetyl-anhydromuramyl-L-alanine amidase AmpD